MKAAQEVFLALVLAARLRRHRHGGYVRGVDSGRGGVQRRRAPLLQ